jgi:DNA polymerase-3 subunit delta
MKPNLPSTQVYVFSGEDDYLFIEEVKQLIDRLVPAAEQTLGLEMIEGQARNAAEAATAVSRCIESLRTAGFFGGRKVTWLKGANFLDRSMIAMANEVSEARSALARLLEAGLPAGNVFIITTHAFDRSSALFKTCAAKGHVSRQDELKPYQKEKAAIGFVLEMLRKNNLQSSTEAAVDIVGLAGTDSRQLAHEVEKLVAFIYPRRNITGEDVMTIISPARESEVINLADAVGKRDLKEALRLMRQLLFQKENPIGLVMALETRFRYLFFLREATAKNEEKIIGLLTSDKGKPMHPYYLSKLKEQAGYFSRQELAESREVLLQTRLQLVSTAGPEEILLEKLLVNICRRQKTKR